MIALVVVLAGYTGYALLTAPRPGPNGTLTVYTYSSLLGGACPASPTLAGVLAPFESAHGVTVDIVCPAGTLVNTLLAQKAAPVADVVVGLDEVTAPEAEANGLLAPYASPAQAEIDPAIAAELSPDHAVTPYEWGYLAIDYNETFAAGAGGAIEHMSFPALASNATWAHDLMIEDPTQDITGEEFLLWEIAYYDSVVHGDWTGFWKAVDPELRVAADWSDAYDAFLGPTDPPAMVVSYSTDPASADPPGPASGFNATVSWSNGTAYGWRSVYGVGVVNGTHQSALARAFVDWFLSPTVQEELPTNEWEYPANSTVPLPPVFQYAIDPGSITPLNGALGPSTIASSLPGWIDEWQTLENQYGG